MKRTDLSVLMAGSAYTFLFYHQSAGLNFLLFTLLLVGVFIYLNPAVLKAKTGVIVIILSVLTGVFILMYGSSLAIFANILSLLLLAAVSVNDKSSVVFSLLFSMYSIAGAFVFWILDNINFSKQKSSQNEKSNYQRVLTYIVPVLLALIFFFIYKTANPLFEKYTEKFNLDFISVQWILFTIGGFLLVLGLIRHRRINEIDNWENNLTLTILPSTPVSKWNENRAIIILFVLLNFMLLSINVLDVNYLYLGAGMPEGVTHKQFVHNGVGTLIFSILMGIVIILYSFRGQLNFKEKDKIAKYLIYAWILQNLFMVISTAVRNNIYVVDALLTYKRVGVYYWLLMAFFGLITTYFKVLKLKSAWYLFRVNSLIAYVVLALSSGIDWDKFISDYNISHIKVLSNLDKSYLIDISETNIAQLYVLQKKAGFDVDQYYHYNYNDRYYSNSKSIDYKLYSFFEDSVHDDWKSFSFRKQRVIMEIEALNNLGKIDSLNLSKRNVKSLRPIFSITNVKNLDLSFCELQSYTELLHFKKLESLSLSCLNNKNLAVVGALKQLKYLYLYATGDAIVKQLQKVLPNTKITTLTAKY